MDLEHIERLALTASGPRDTYSLTWVPQGVEESARYVQFALAEKAAGRALPYVTVRTSDQRIVGSTRFFSFDYWDWGAQTKPERPGPDALEIGYTWLAQDAQRSVINSEAKLLMLDFAFDVLRVERVFLKTDARNQRSRSAIERIGARFEGVLRRHMPAADGGVRDTAMFAFIAPEWPDARARLVARLASRADR
jgi:RimJ/RimL family protein N-acetyltransferase